MQSRIQVSANNVAEKPFPKLMSGKNNSGLVVFFREPRIGVVVHPNNVWEVGHLSDMWGMESFTDFEGIIELENDK